jgi:predicted HAD superfamily Cof-like phosphohydrolase
MASKDLRTHFELVGEFHDTFGHPMRSKPYDKCFDDQKLVNLRRAVIDEENKEFKDALKVRDVKEIADAFCDLAYFVYGAGHAFGINLDYAMWHYEIDISTKSNTTKRVTSDTLDVEFIKYKSTGIDGIIQMLNIGLDDKNLHIVARYLAYLLKCVYDLGHAIGFNMDAMFREVHRSNMTKTCPTVEDAQTTVDLYVKEGLYEGVYYKPKDSYYVVCAGNGKVLKNHKWEVPNLAQFL